jgi:diguanylate cyclase (GGDEF)-like protein
VVATSLHTNPRQGALTALNAWALVSGVALLEAHGVLPHGPLAPTPLAASLAADAGYVEAQVLALFVLLGAVTYSAGFIAARLRVRENELSRAHDELEILYQASERFLRAQNAARLTAELCRAACRLGASEAAVFLEEDGATQELGHHPVKLGTEARQALHERAERYFLSLPGDPVHEHLEDEEDYGVVRFQLAEGTRGALVVRTSIEDLIGASPEGSSLLAQQFAPALQSLRHLEAQATLATTDPLTGAANRREFDRFLDQEIARASRYQRPLSVVLVDVDHFKRLNDTRGHQDGDRVLQLVVAAMRRVVRNQDLLARYGGEEFAVVAPETGPRQAGILGERLRSAIQEATYWEEGDLGPEVTASLGVSSRLPTSDGIGYDELIRRADLALYASKEGGRNRVTIYGSELEAAEAEAEAASAPA